LASELWMPGKFTPSLSGTEDFPTDGDKLIRVVDAYYRDKDSPGLLVLDPPQRWLIRHMLERYPADWHDERLAGRLRYTEICVSMGRQNGKSLIGAVLALYGMLMHVPNPEVVGVAATADQVRQVYNRVAWTVANSPKFKGVITPTVSKAIRRNDGRGQYKTLPAKELSIQSSPVSLGIMDEVHLLKQEVWDAIAAGTSNYDEAIVIGITTAGDDNSKLLKTLYDRGEQAITGHDERFGFFVWEAPAGSTIDDDAAIIAANPSVACGRKSVEDRRDKWKARGKTAIDHYLFNQFVASVNGWVDTDDWLRITGEGLSVQEALDNHVVYGIDVSSEYDYVTITANAKVADVVKSRIVFSGATMNRESILEECKRLKALGACTFAFDDVYLKWLRDEMKSRGWEHYALNTQETCEAWSTMLRLVINEGVQVRRKDDTLAAQVFRGKAVWRGDSWRIDRHKSGVETDALFATAMGVYIAETRKPATLQLFV